MKISGFTFIHNALAGGYPIVEAIRAVQPYVNEVVIVDCASTDGTREILESLAQTNVYDAYGYNRTVPIRIVEGEWGDQAGETLRQAHSKYSQCEGDVILHFEGDEVYSNSLIKSVVNHINGGHTNLSVMRLQIEQNFQRCRWYPEPVHRIFPRNAGVMKEGHTTNQQDQSFLLTEKYGYLWDITNCFRDNWLGRVEAQAELRGETPNYLMVGQHCTWDVDLAEGDARQWLISGKHWTWTRTPFDIPEILRPLVGMVRYEPEI